MTQAAPAVGDAGAAERGRYARILLKISGEALLGRRSYGVDPEMCAFIASQVREVRESGVDVVDRKSVV